MLGMHGTVVANYAVDHADLLLAFGVRFDDRVTGKLEAFATRARIVHIDIDPAEINKNKEAHISMCSDMRPTLKLLNAAVAKSPVDRSCYDDWRADIVEQQEKYPQSFPTRDDVIIPQEAVKVGLQTVGLRLLPLSRFPCLACVEYKCNYHLRPARNYRLQGTTMQERCHADVGAPCCDLLLSDRPCFCLTGGSV